MAQLIDETSRIIKIGDAISQLINVALLPRHKETNANESISGRAYRNNWFCVVKFIDFIFSPVEKNHCKLSYKKDIERAKQLLENLKDD